MLANLFTWISKIVRLVLITRSSFDEIMAELNDLRDALAKYRAAYEQVISEAAAVQEQVKGYEAEIAELKAWSEEGWLDAIKRGEQERTASGQLNAVVGYSQEKIIALHNNVALALDRLSLIAEKETASANATVRKMAKIAREAISEIIIEEAK